MEMNNMKMKLFRMITACMVGGAMLMTSCSSDDNATDDGQEIESIGVAQH